MSAPRKVVSKSFDAYSSIPTWTLTLSCGHKTTFSAESPKDVLTRPPVSVECDQCGGLAQQTNENEKGTKVMSKHMVKMFVGAVVMLNCKAHVCFEVGSKKSKLAPKDAKTVADEKSPFGFRPLEHVVEGAKMNQIHFVDPVSREEFKPMRPEEILSLFRANAVPLEEAEQLDAKQSTDMAKKTAAAKTRQTKPKPDTGGATAKSSEPRPSQILRALGKAGVSVKHGQAIAAKQGWDLNPSLVSNYIRDGKGGAGSIATLEASKLEELRACAPDPTAAPAPAA